MDPQVPLHPVVVHTPLALILFSLFFDIVGRLTDLQWWRKAAFAMLIFGVLGAWAAVYTGNAAEEAAEDQGVPHELIESHEAAGVITAWLGTLAVLARALAARPGAARTAFSILALVTHLLTAGAVSMAGFRGGILVYEHGAGVKAAPETPGVQAHDDHED